MGSEGNLVYPSGRCGHDAPCEAAHIGIESRDMKTHDGEERSCAAREPGEVAAAVTHQQTLAGSRAAGHRCRSAKFARNDPRRPATSESEKNPGEGTPPARQVSEPLLLQPLRQARRSLVRCATYQVTGRREIPCCRRPGAKGLPTHAGTPLPKLAKSSLARARPLGVRR